MVTEVPASVTMPAAHAAGFDVVWQIAAATRLGHFWFRAGAE